MIAYKLFRERKDGTLGPLFINRGQVIQVGDVLFAEDHPTKGFAHRPGWHCTSRPIAPHLKMDLKNGEKRVWCEVWIEYYSEHKRPENQGGLWYLAERMEVKRKLTQTDINKLAST